MVVEYGDVTVVVRRAGDRALVVGVTEEGRVHVRLLGRERGRWVCLSDATLDVCLDPLPPAGALRVAA